MVSPRPQPSQPGPDVCAGTCLDGHERDATATLCATLKSDLDLVGHLAVRDAIGDSKGGYNKRYKSYIPLLHGSRPGLRRPLPCQDHSCLYLVPARHVLYATTWMYVSGWTSWCWRLLEGVFPSCSFSDHMINAAWASPPAGPDGLILEPPKVSRSTGSIPVVTKMRPTSPDSTVVPAVTGALLTPHWRSTCHSREDEAHGSYGARDP